MSAGALLEIDNLSVEFATERGALRAVAGVSLSVGASHALGIVGKSGSGKTVLSRAVLQLLPHNARVSGAVRFDGRELFRLSREAFRQLRGREIAVVFQDPMTSLNPVLTVGGQIAEALREHLGLGPQRLSRGCKLLAQSASPTRAARAPISSPDVGRHAPAGSDRDRTLLRAAPAHRGRADDCA